METPSITQSEFEGTNVRHFLAHKGSVVVKEYREIARLKSNYYEGNEVLADYDEAYEKAMGAFMEAPVGSASSYKKLEELEVLGDRPEDKNPTVIVSTLILGIIKGKDQQTTFGVKLESVGTLEHVGRNVFIDFDELPELMDAIDFIQSKADILKPQKCDYTELIYATRDDAQFGFYQETNQEQTAFIKFQDATAYLKLSDLLTLKNHFLKAQEHLISRGASMDNY